MVGITKLFRNSSTVTLIGQHEPKDFGLMFRRVPGDGRCAFGAVAATLLHEENRDFSDAQLRQRTTELRQQAIAELRNNKTAYRDFVVDGKTLEQRISDLERGAWGDNLEIAAMQKILGRYIVPISRRAAHIDDETLLQLQGGTSANPIFVFYHEGMHYDALLTLKDTNPKDAVVMVRNANEDAKARAIAARDSGQQLQDPVRLPSQQPTLLRPRQPAQRGENTPQQTFPVSPQMQQVVNFATQHGMQAQVSADNQQCNMTSADGKKISVADSHMSVVNAIDDAASLLSNVLAVRAVEILGSNVGQLADALVAMTKQGIVANIVRETVSQVDLPTVLAHLKDTNPTGYMKYVQLAGQTAGVDTRAYGGPVDAATLVTNLAASHPLFDRIRRPAPQQQAPTDPLLAAGSQPMPEDDDNSFEDGHENSNDDTISLENEEYSPPISLRGSSSTL